jgi:hypothetical protein
VKKKILRGKKRETIERVKGGKEKKRKKCGEKAKRRKKLHLEGVAPKLRRREKRGRQKKRKRRRKRGEKKEKQEQRRAKKERRRRSQRKSAVVRQTGVRKHGHLVFHMTTFGCGVEAVVFTDCAFFILGRKNN